MEKTDLLLAASEHPESLSPEDIKRLLSDPETAEIYRMMTVCATALNGQSQTTGEQIDREWERFRQTATARRRPSFFRRSAAATITAAISLAAVAGIAVITTRHFRHSDTAAPATEVQVQTASTQSAQSPVIEEPSEKAGSLTAENKSVVFEDETLRTILDRIARHYGTEIVYRSTETGDLRLYFRWDTSARLEETVEALNNFEKINLSLDNNKITVL